MFLLSGTNSSAELAFGKKICTEAFTRPKVASNYLIEYLELREKFRLLFMMRVMTYFASPVSIEAMKEKKVF